MVILDVRVDACKLIFKSDLRRSMVRGSDPEEDERQGLQVWSRHVGDPILKSNFTPGVEVAMFMVAAMENELIHEAAAVVGYETHSAPEDTNIGSL